MFVVYMEVDGEAYVYGRYTDRDKANETALQVREQRQIEVYVIEED